MKKSILFLAAAMMLTAASAVAQNQVDKQGRRQGHWIRTDKDGSKIFEGDFKDGLETGVFEMSPDCRTQMLNFNTDNSPLPSNSVSSMVINEDGEVFFGTEAGVISYRGSATPGGTTNTDVVVYPNPVRPGYSGYVGIKGLVEDALVRITTVDGAFVTELIAQGGQAVWDCTALDGKKVNPGIYLVFVSTTKGTQKYATKILIMN